MKRKEHLRSLRKRVTCAELRRVSSSVRKTNASVWRRKKTLNVPALKLREERVSNIINITNC